MPIPGYPARQRDDGGALRFLIVAAQIPLQSTDHGAEAVRDGIVAMSTLPAHLRGSLTWDWGSEMAAHSSFRIATDMDVYFCDPASPWQSGSNENTNGLLASTSRKAPTCPSTVTS